MERVLYSDSFRKQVQGKAAFVLDTPEMRRVRETQRIISGVRYHEDFEKNKGSFTPTTSDPVTDRVKKNTQDFSDISYRGIQRRVVEMERRRAMEHDQETITDLRVWRTNPGSVFDYDPAEDNIQSRSLHMMSVQAQRRSKEHSRSTSALSGMADEKSEVSQDADHHMSLYSNGFMTSSTGYQHAKTVELQQRSSSVATQQTTVSSIPSHPSTTGKTVRAMYDYSAADNDEVSFKDGDVIVNVQSIDEGWMYGTVQRTGKTGMLPANYIFGFCRGCESTLFTFQSPAPVLQCEQTGPLVILLLLGRRELRRQIHRLLEEVHQRLLGQQRRQDLSVAHRPLLFRGRTVVASADTRSGTFCVVTSDPELWPRWPASPICSTRLVTVAMAWKSSFSSGSPWNML
ncbi:hypothetical protein INR49_026914 [Caranx melampygus]|nr:hypothetical protein INR49_026914 [Caranx melampygus]